MDTTTRGDGAVRRADRPGDLDWIITAHDAVYSADGWTPDFVAMVADIVAAFGAGHDQRREAAWVAERDGRRVGSVMCVADDEPGTARLRVLVVTANARGSGLGRRLVTACVDFARAAGYRRMVLWTVGELHAARRLYEDAGFRLVAEDPADRFGAHRVGQDWALDL